jgi:hypothetical protein
MAIPNRGAIRREVRGQRRTYTTEVTSAGVIIREKGRRSAVGPVSWDSIYDLGAKQEAAANGHPVPRPRRRRRVRA